MKASTLFRAGREENGMRLIAVMGPMTANDDASGNLAVFLAGVAFFVVAGLSYWLQYRKLPPNTQSKRNEHNE
jgi:hypothetical protein